MFSITSFFASSRIHCFGDSNVLFNFTNNVQNCPLGKFSIEEFHQYDDFSIPFIINGFIGKTIHGVSKIGVLDIESYGVEENEIAMFIIMFSIS